MIDIAMAVVTAALLALFAALLVMAAREDMKEERRRRKQAREQDVWVRYPTNPTDQAYNAFLNEHNISTWPYEPWAGYDERREA